MTQADKAQASRRIAMTKGDEAEATSIEVLKPVKVAPKLEKVPISDRFFMRNKKSRKLLVRTWVNVSGQEVCIEEKETKLGEPDIEIGKNKYGIDYTSIQNILGQNVYNTVYRVANGALRYTSQSAHDVDAKMRKTMNSRDNLHAIWSRWQLPIIACIIAMVVAVIALSILGVIMGSWQTAQDCLKNETCMVQKIAQLRAQAEAEAKRQAEQAGGANGD